MFKKILSLLLIGALIAGCASETNPVTGKRERTVMDEQEELAIGKEAHEQIIKSNAAYPDQALQAYVNEVGQRLAKESHRTNLQWHFTVLDTPDINAFALPGGYIYITRGLMAYLEDEADLAGVLGHEIGHVTARHSSQRATRQQTAGIGVLLATVLGAVLESKGIGGAGQLLNQGSQSIAGGYVASYSRNQELQADKLGAEYLARGDYDPNNMVEVINVLQQQEKYAIDQAKAEGREVPAGTSWLASHPSNAQRLQDIKQIASSYDGDYSRDKGEARYLKAISGMTFGDSKEQGVTRGRNFYHEGLGIALTAPEGWKIQNSPDALRIVNPTGDAGLVMVAVPTDAGNTHEEIIRNVFKPSTGKVQAVDVNGFAATHFVGTRSGPQGQAQPVETTIVTGPAKRNYAFLYAAKNPETLRAAQNGIRQAQSSFRAMTSADAALAKPWKIKTNPYPKAGFSQLAKSSPLPDAEQQLRLMNGVYSEGEPKVGEPVKVVE